MIFHSGSHIPYWTFRFETPSCDCTWQWNIWSFVQLYTFQSYSDTGLYLYFLNQTLVVVMLVISFSIVSLCLLIFWQAFHVLYHSNKNVLLGAPTGSGKTISAELAMLHLFNTQPDMKVLVFFAASNFSSALLWMQNFEPVLICGMNDEELSFEI